MRCVVSAVTEESNVELHEELGRAEAELQDYDEEDTINDEEANDQGIPFFFSFSCSVS